MKYSFIELISQEPLKSDFDEDRKVKELMSLHGIDNVRGGSYCQIKLSGETKVLLEKEINHASGHCFECKKPGHVAKQCPEKKKQSTSCERCERKNHTRDKCFANYTQEGIKLCKGINKNGSHCAKKIEDNYIYCYKHKDQT